MDSMPNLYVSSVLRDAARLKVDELNHAKNDFRRLYQQHAGKLSGNDLKTQLKELVDDVIKLYPSLEDADDFQFIFRCINQADDQSISQAKLLKIKQELLGRLQLHSRRLECSSLHVELMKEAMVSCDVTTSTAGKLASVDLDDDFEVVDSNELNDLLEKFEKETFATDDVDVATIEAYLTRLASDLGDSTLLTKLHEDVREFAEEALSDGMEIGQDFMMWCVADLLKNDLISEEKKRILSDYLQSPIALKELASIINAKSLRLWDYKNAEAGLLVTVRQDAQGTPRVAIEEGIIDMLLLHCVGIGFSMKLKSCLDSYVGCSESFKSLYLQVEERVKRDFFLGRHPLQMLPPLPPVNVCSMCHPYPPAPMPPPPPDMGMCPPPPPMMDMCPPPPPPEVIVVPTINYKKKSKAGRWVNHRMVNIGGLDNLRNRYYLRDFFLSHLPEEDGCSPNVTPMEEVQANLIKTLAVQGELRKAFDGQVRVGSVKFNALCSSLPHKTILTVLKFLGFPEETFNMFEHFLSAKLNIGPAVRGAPDRVLPRARGVPEGHALELFFTEAVMCFLELIVRQSTGAYLYRLKDRCYFIGNNEQYLLFEEQALRFADVMGLDISFERSRSLGLLTFADDNISINDREADAYAHIVKKQLDACTTVFDWVRVWNNTIGTYAAHLFGPLSKIMGKAHLHSVKKTYKSMFDIVLENGDLTAHITSLLSKHIKLGPSIAVEPLIYLPQAYGGLGVKNPFVTLALAHEMPEDPNADIASFLASEEAYYHAAAANYAILDADGRARKLEAIFENDQARIDAALGPDRDLSVFMSKDELVAYRERARYPVLPFPPFPAPYSPTAVPSLTNLYDDLLTEVSDDVSCSEKIQDEVCRLSGKGDMRSYRHLSGEDRWVLQLYGDECFEAYGGLEIWCGENVPQEVLRVVRGGTWDDDDDDSSTGSYVSGFTEP
ncbi:hypothetical protein IQ06DRAFT_290270 [Phaeosphaeriaceae sp. SRC1lsM3a]|nr:hypothetical protein IQ06DRAFT_290270 [Stagonospora sp. SRC1lsM3a]